MRVQYVNPIAKQYAKPIAKQFANRIVNAVLDREKDRQVTHRPCHCMQYAARQRIEHSVYKRIQYAAQQRIECIETAISIPLLHKTIEKQCKLNTKSVSNVEKEKE